MLALFITGGAFHEYEIDGFFWIGVFERREGGSLSTFKVVFGNEPYDQDVMSLVCTSSWWDSFGAAMPDDGKDDVKEHGFKHRQREISRELKRAGVGTKAMQAMKISLEQSKEIRKKSRSDKKEKEKEAHFISKQLKKKEKKRGH